MLKKKDPPMIISSPSSTEEGSVHYCEELDDWNESEGTDEETASISDNLEVGKFVLAEVLGGKRNTSQYVYLCTVLEVFEEELKVQGFVSVDNMKKFVVRENDEFIVPLCQIKGVILNSPEVNWVERKLTYIFKKKLPVNEKA
ncbi:unnamed protein product [Psylliodes chrysocephalus]|uniref:Uncharacterized protein n=1 Tax=Psylliodes chrysocephalus TaxID=3402493 RepID=A0A9P0CFW6_9CUCU|nr:unnamed protein product [Psylliodes chrysocephala]